MSNDTQANENRFAAQQQLLFERLQIYWGTLAGSLRADVLLALEAEGKLLSLERTATTSQQVRYIVGSWSLLTFLTAQMIRPEIDVDVASSVAVATECFICALDLLDDVEDEDQTAIVQALGIARTLNVSTTLLMLTQQALLSLTQNHVPAERILLLLDALQACALSATAGQHRDLLAEQQLARDFTQEDCIEIARGKAGSLMRLAFLLGAICAEADEQVCEQFSKLGELLGIAHQLDNDAHDLYYLLQDASVGEASNGTPVETKSAPKTRKTDLTRGKKTLPIVLAAHSENALQGNIAQADEQKQEQQRALQAGIITTWGMYLLYRERAREQLQKIEAHLPVSLLLRQLLDL